MCKTDGLPLYTFRLYVFLVMYTGIHDDVCDVVVYPLQYGTTALMVASYSGHHECARELVMQGADINLQREVFRQFKTHS